MGCEQDAESLLPTLLPDGNRKGAMWREYYCCPMQASASTEDVSRVCMQGISVFYTPVLFNSYTSFKCVLEQSVQSGTDKWCDMG